MDEGYKNIPVPNSLDSMEGVEQFNVSYSSQEEKLGYEEKYNQLFTKFKKSFEEAKTDEEKREIIKNTFDCLQSPKEIMDLSFNKTRRAIGLVKKLEQEGFIMAGRDVGELLIKNISSLPDLNDWLSPISEEEKQKIDTLGNGSVRNKNDSGYIYLVLGLSDWKDNTDLPNSSPNDEVEPIRPIALTRTTFLDNVGTLSTNWKIQLTHPHEHLNLSYLRALTFKA